MIEFFMGYLLGSSPTKSVKQSYWSMCEFCRGSLAQHNVTCPCECHPKQTLDEAAKAGK